MERVALEFGSEKYSFNLDLGTKHWVENEPDSHEPLDEGDFPLAIETGGKRYELYSDATFAEVERR